MKLGLHVATICKNADLETALEICEKHGYDVIELRLDMLRDYLTRHSINELADWFQTHHLKPHTLNPAPFFNFRDEEGWKELTDGFRQTCEYCEAIGCQTVNTVPTSNVGAYSTQDIFEESVSSLQKLSEVGKPYGVRLSLEYLGQPNCSVNTFRQAYDIVKAVDSDFVGLTFDSFHFHAMNSHLEDLAQADPNKIFTVHINDCEDYPVGQLNDALRLWPGLGCINLQQQFETLRKIGYDGVVSVEEFRPAYYELTAEQAVKTAKETSLKVLQCAGYEVK